jgi:hypothetical protein
VIRKNRPLKPDVQPEELENDRRLRLNADTRIVLDKVVVAVVLLPEERSHLSEVGVAVQEEIDQVEGLLGIHQDRSGLEAGRSLGVEGILAVAAGLEEAAVVEVRDFAEA